MASLQEMEALKRGEPKRNLENLCSNTWCGAGAKVPNLPYDYKEEYEPLSLLPQEVRNAILKNAERLLAPLTLPH